MKDKDNKVWRKRKIELSSLEKYFDFFRRDPGDRPEIPGIAGMPDLPEKPESKPAEMSKVGTEETAMKPNKEPNEPNRGALKFWEEPAPPPPSQPEPQVQSPAKGYHIREEEEGNTALWVSIIAFAVALMLIYYASSIVSAQ